MESINMFMHVSYFDTLWKLKESIMPRSITSRRTFWVSADFQMFRLRIQRARIKENAQAFWWTSHRSRNRKILWAILVNANPQGVELHLLLQSRVVCCFGTPGQYQCFLKPTNGPTTSNQSWELVFH